MPVRVRRYARRRVRPRESPVVRGEIDKIRAQLKHRDSASQIESLREFMEEGRMHEYPGFIESAVDTLDDLLGFDVVPPTVLRQNPKTGDIVSVQEWVPNSAQLHSSAIYHISQLTVRTQRDLMKIAIIDIIVNQADRHNGNILVDEKERVWAIDNEGAFGGRGVVMWHESFPYEKSAGKSIPPDMLQKLQDLDEGDFRAAFAGVEKQLVDEAWSRKLWLQELGHIPEKEIDFSVIGRIIYRRTGLAGEQEGN